MDVVMIPTREENDHIDNKKQTTTTTTATNKRHTFDVVGIINDSVFALREFSDIFDRFSARSIKP